MHHKNVKKKGVSDHNIEFHRSRTICTDYYLSITISVDDTSNDENSLEIQ